MSITKMRVFCSKYLSKWVFMGLVGVFVIGSVAYFGGGGARGGQERSDDTGKVIATVNGKSITKGELITMLQLQIAASQGRLVSPIQNNDAEMETLRQIMMDKMKVDAAEKEGISIGFFETRREKSKLLDQYQDWIRQEVSQGEKIKLSDDQINSRLAAGIPLQKQMILPSGSVQVVVTVQRTSLDQLRNEMDQQLSGDTLNNVLMMQKLDDRIKAKAGKVNDEQLQAVFTTVKARHILIAARSFPDPQAETKANKILEQLKAGADFATLAKANSDDPLTKNSGGEYPRPIRAIQDKDIQGLKKGETSGVVQSPSLGGYRIIQVEDIQTKLPPDFAANKARYREAVQTQLIDKQAIESFNRDMQSKVRVEIKDPEIKACWLASQVASMAESQPKIAQQGAPKAIDLLMKAQRSATNQSAVQCRLAQMYKIMGNDDKALAAMEDAVGRYNAVGSDISLFLAELYVKKGDRTSRTKALDALNKAGQIGWADRKVHGEMREYYKKLGATDLVAKEQKVLDDMDKRDRASRPTSMGPSGPSGAPGG